MARLSIAMIQHQVAKAFGMDPVMMRSSQRNKKIARPRQIAMWLANDLMPQLSMPQIGRAFGKRDWSTVAHGVRKIEEMRRSDPAFATLTDDLRMAVVGEVLDLEDPSVIAAERLAVSLAEAFAAAALRLARTDPEAAFRAFKPLAAELLTPPQVKEAETCPAG